MRLTKRKCDKCTRQYTPESPRQNWCAKCLTVTCNQCKKKFRSIRSKIEKNLVKYCSKPCRIEADKKRAFEHQCSKCKKLFSSKSSNVKWCKRCCTVKCVVCGKSVVKKPFEIKNKTAKYCSVPCQNKGTSAFVWNKKQREFIKRNYSKMTRREIADHFGAPLFAVDRALKEIGVKNTKLEWRNKNSRHTNRKWSQKTIISELEQLNRTGHINYTQLKEERQDLVNAIRKYFVSYQDAIEAAGINYEDSRYKPRACEKCGNVFSDKNTRRCVKCRTIKCKTCGDRFEASPKDIDEGLRVYCSRPCLYKGRKIQISKTCTECKKDFLATNGNITVCDNCCTITCSVCGKSKRVKAHKVSTTDYCSRKCQREGQMIYAFTEIDEQFIKENYPYKISMKELAEKYSTSINAISRIVRRLGCENAPTSLRNKRSGETRRKWYKSNAIKALQKLSKTGPINAQRLQREWGSLYIAGINIFGSYKEFVEAAGFDYSEINLYAHRITWTYDKIIRRIKKLHKEGFSLEASEVRDNHADVFVAARREVKLGTWEKAVEAAGFDYSEIRRASFGSPVKGLDGRTYASKREADVADTLFEYKRNKTIRDYKIQVRIAKERHWRCDFVVQKGKRNLWLEVDGLGGARQEGAYTKSHPKIKYFLKNEFNFAVINHVRELKPIIKDFIARKPVQKIKKVKRRNLVELGSNRYTDQELLDAMRRVFHQLGNAPTQKEFEELTGISSQTVRRRIGWKKSIAEVINK